MTNPSARLPLRDTPQVYGLITRTLHWTIALLLVWQFLGMGLRIIFGRQPFVSFFVQWHQPIGTILFVLIVLRIIWALSNISNRPPHGTGFRGFAVRAGHGLLYLAMLVIPSVALLRAWGSDRVFAPFGFQIFDAKVPPIDWTASLAGAVHGELAWVLGVMIIGHVVMVAVHEGMWRDGTFARMAGRVRGRAATH